MFKLPGFLSTAGIDEKLTSNPKFVEFDKAISLVLALMYACTFACFAFGLVQVLRQEEIEWMLNICRVSGVGMLASALAACIMMAYSIEHWSPLARKGGAGFAQGPEKPETRER